jgi:hypothetical protein
MTAVRISRRISEPPPGSLILAISEPVREREERERGEGRHRDECGAWREGREERGEEGGETRERREGRRGVKQERGGRRGERFRERGER